jgi:hypothetical protein
MVQIFVTLRGDLIAAEDHAWIGRQRAMSPPAGRAGRAVPAAAAVG